MLGNRVTAFSHFMSLTIGVRQADPVAAWGIGRGGETITFYPSTDTGGRSFVIGIPTLQVVPPTGRVMKFRYVSGFGN